MTFELNERERDLMAELLEKHLKDILIEIRHSVSRDFRHELEAKQRLVESLQERFKAERPAAS